MVGAEDHGEKANEHLEEAIKSGKKGSAQGVRIHAEEAKKELIEQNRKHPYTTLQKPLYGEYEKAEHDRDIFEEMDLAIEEAKKENTEEAIEAIERASVHLEKKERSR